MRYIATGPLETAIAHTVSTISSHLQAGRRVTWLLSGGSAIELEVQIAQTLQARNTTRLYIGLIDERYGPIGHKDENYLQLMNAHFPLLIHRVLGNKPPQKTAESFGQQTLQAIEDSDYSLGIFGIGGDGHTAGIKPHSPTTSTTTPAIFYEWDDYKRITLTPKAISLLDEAVIYAVGSEKASTLKTLVYDDISLDEQPAQVLKTIKTATLYTDNIL